MTKVSRLGLCPLVVLAALVSGFFAPAPVCLAEDGVRLRAIDPKPFYKPGDRIELELRCLGAVIEEPVVLYNPSLEKIDSGSFVPDLPRCPSSRFPIEIPLAFMGKNRVTARVQHGERRYEDVFEFEVRSDARPSDLRLTTESLTDDSQDEGCHLPIFRKGRAPSEIHLFSVMGDGIQFDLCKGVQFTVATEPAGSGVVALKDGHCILTPKKPGAFRLVASYRGLRKEWSCTEDASESKPPAPRPTAVTPSRPMSRRSRN
jgi:hypothetical protein